MSFRPKEEIISLDTTYLSCRAATTANVTLSGLQTVDTVSLVAGDRVLVKNQSTGLENGIYVSLSGGWLRAFDMESGTSVINGKLVYVREGSANVNRIYAIRYVGGVGGHHITIGTDGLAFPSVALT